MVTDLEITVEDRRQLERVATQFTRDKTNEHIFYDLMFCICSPGVKFHYNLQANQNLIDNDYYRKNITTQRLWKLLRPTRWYRNKTKCVQSAKKLFPDVLAILDNGMLMQVEKRDFLVKNVRGLGMKTASHFLRNCGADDLAIVDVHVLNFMGAEQPSGKKRYMEIETGFRDEARRYKLSVAKLDMLVWKKFSGVPWEEFTM